MQQAKGPMRLRVLKKDLQSFSIFQEKLLNIW